MNAAARGRGRSLLESRPGRTATVETILFECLRERCDALGIHEGDRLVVETREGESIVLRTDDAHRLRCPADVARFVEVR